MFSKAYAKTLEGVNKKTKGFYMIDEVLVFCAIPHVQLNYVRKKIYEKTDI